MKMLWLIGLGINDENDMPMKALDALKNCDMIFAETYTSGWRGSFEKLEKIAGKTIEMLSREKVESDFLADIARENDVALLIPGDPLTATTHFELFYSAKKEGIKCSVIHASSVYTAVAETGMQIYKFGRATTLPNDFRPGSPLEIIKENKKAGLHTLVLLDIGMKISDALEILSECVRETEKIILCKSLGSEEQEIFYGTLKELEKTAGKNETVQSCIIIPGKLNFKEEEYLCLWAEK